MVVTDITFTSSSPIFIFFCNLAFFFFLPFLILVDHTLKNKLNVCIFGEGMTFLLQDILDHNPIYRSRMLLFLVIFTFWCPWLLYGNVFRIHHSRADQLLLLNIRRSEILDKLLSIVIEPQHLPKRTSYLSIAISFFFFSDIL